MVESVKWSHLPNKCLRAEHKKIRRRYLGGKVLSHYLKNGCVSKLLRQKFLSCFLRLKITTRYEYKGNISSIFWVISDLFMN